VLVSDHLRGGRTSRIEKTASLFYTQKARRVRDRSVRFERPHPTLCHYDQWAQ